MWSTKKGSSCEHDDLFLNSHGFLTDGCEDELLLRLKGSAFASQGSLAGRYTKAGTSGGKPYWTNGDWALWARHDGRWRFGPKNKIGEDWQNLLSIEWGRFHVCPENASWKYWGTANHHYYTWHNTWHIAGEDGVKVLKHSGFYKRK